MAGAVSGARVGGVPKRFIVTCMCFVAVFICYIDRVNISVAIIPMADQYHWSGTTKGWVLSSFFIGYLAGMVPAGWLANRYGGRRVMAVALVGEAGSFPSTFNLFARWIPLSERSRASAINLTGIPLGTIFALSTTGWLIVQYDWPTVFYAFGALGLIFAIVWVWLIHANPAAHPTISDRERTLLAPLAISETHSKTPVPWGLLLSHKAVWAIIINHFCANWTLYLMLSWLPSYFRDTLHLSVTNSGLFSILPWICQFAIGNFAAHVADRMIAGGADVTRVRKIMQCSGLIGAAVSLLAASQATTPGFALFTICAALGLGAMCWAGFYANYLDVAPEHSDILYGIGNIGGTIPGALGAVITGWLLDVTGGYTATFVLAAAISAFGALVWVAWGKGERITEVPQ
jgi:MFS transporter, ACS family, solute carrier family 17 (sodium-dependent inorganic phosphate cotransporter), other